MKPSPTISKILSAYAVVFAGIAPAILGAVGIWHGIGISLVYNVAIGAAVTYFGIRVLRGDQEAITLFATLVALYYLGLTVTNVLYYDNFPVGTRARQMAVPRAIRGVVFAGVYIWYFLLRKGTRQGFASSSAADSGLDWGGE